MKVYAVTITAIYDHGLAGIYTSYDAAFKRAEELWGISDGHHSFYIEEIEVDQPFDEHVDVLAPDKDMKDYSNHKRKLALDRGIIPVRTFLLGQSRD